MGAATRRSGWRNLTHQRLQAIAAAAALATIELLDDPRSQPEGRVARRRRQAGTVRASARSFGGVGRRRGSVPRCLTASLSNETALRFVPSCRPAMDQAPDALAKLQIRSSPLDEIERVGAVPNGGGLLHRGHPARRDVVGQAGSAVRARRAMGVDAVRFRRAVRAWECGGTADHQSSIRHEALWAKLVVDAPVQIHDGGFTEVPAGTKTAVAWWAEPFGH